MNEFIMRTAACCLCIKPANKTAVANLNYLGIDFPVVAVLCKKCHALPNRDQLLRRYVDSIFFHATEKTKKQCAT